MSFLSHQLERPKIAGSDNGVPSLSIAFIECQAFKDAFRLQRVECCPDCHSHSAEHPHGQLIYVRPHQPGSPNPDWLLCIEGIVCCQMYHAILNVPYTWWAAEAQRLGVARVDMRGHIYPASPGRNTDPPKTQVKISVAEKQRRRRVAAQPEERSMDDFMRRR